MSKPLLSYADAKKVARSLREKVREKGEFDLKEYREKLAKVMANFQSLAFDAFCDRIAKQIDDEETASNIVRNPLQPDLPGIDLGGEYVLDKGRRIAKRLSMKEHMEKALMIDDANTRNVNRANIRKHDEYEMLVPFWKKGETKAEAAERYEQAQKLTGNPGRPSE